MEYSRQRRSRVAMRSAVAAGIIAVAGFASYAATPAHARVRNSARVTSSHLLQTATASNTTGDFTEINSSATNGKPHAILFVTEYTTSSAPVDNHSYGVFYAGSEWAIFNEDQQPMPVGAQFFVLAFSGSSSTDFTLTASSGDVDGDSAFINSPMTNGKPTVKLQVTQNWNPGGVGGVYNNHIVGVWDNGAQWGAFNEDGTNMPVGPSFNVLVGSGTSGGSLALQKATPSNISGNITSITNSHSSNHPGALVFVTQDWNPGHHGGTFDFSALGVAYPLRIGGKWAVVNLDGSAMGNKTAFNLLIFSS
jgi:hypothetical protein